MLRMPHRGVSHAAPEVPHPGKVMVPEEQIKRILVSLRRDVEWMPGVAVIKEDSEDLADDPHHILDDSDILNADRVGMSCSPN